MTALDFPPTVKEQNAITPMDMIRLAVEQNADIDKLSKLMDLQDRWEKGEGRKAFIRSLSEFKKNPPTVTKNRKAGFGKTEWEYANLANVVGVIAPALSTHGLSHRWETFQDGEKITVRCTLTHELGHSEDAVMSAPADTSGSKNPVQAIASTISYLERYTLLAVTGLAASDMDDDGIRAVDAKIISNEQKQELVALQKETKADTAKFLAYFGIETIDLLPEENFEQAKILLEKKRNK